MCFDPHLQQIQLHLTFVKLVPGRFPKTETGLSSSERGGTNEREMDSSTTEAVEVTRAFQQYCTASLSELHTSPPHSCLMQLFG